jgi:transcriptional regulator with XRE-family HTH domain
LTSTEQEFHEMDMQLDPHVIRAERKKRAWSQEHLAKVTGLGLRTIQRIEATGTASNESAAALAAVLARPLEHLTRIDPVAVYAERPVRSRNSLIGFTAAIAAGICALVGFNLAFADDISLDVGVSLFEAGEENASQVVATKLLIEDGGDADVEVDGIARFVITPAVRDDGHILINVAVFEFDGSEFVKTREPRVLTDNGRAAEIVFGSGVGRLFRVSITPDQAAQSDSR